jgi:hypothetical protein
MLPLLVLCFMLPPAVDFGLASGMFYIGEVLLL